MKNDCGSSSSHAHITTDVLIIGGGITGLSLALWLLHSCPELSVSVVEQNQLLGGWIQTAKSASSGQIYERGPRSIRLGGKSAEAATEFIRLIGMDQSMIMADPIAQKRYVLYKSHIQEFPSSLRTLAFSSIGRGILLALLKEPLISLLNTSRNQPGSVHDYISHTFNSDIMNQLADAFTSGIWASESSYVSMDAAFPSMAKFFQRHRSVVLGAIQAGAKTLVLQLIGKKKRDGKGQKWGICTFENGMAAFIQAIVNKLHTSSLFSLHRSCSFSDFRYLPELKKWVVEIESEGTCRTVYAASCAIACNPAFFSSELQQKLSEIEFVCPDKKRFNLRDRLSLSITSGVITVSIGWRNDLHLENPALNGFGLLSPQSEDPYVLGIIFDSSVFPSQNRSMKTRISVMMGGTRCKGIGSLDEDILKEIALSRVKKWLRIDTVPDEIVISVCLNSIPIPTHMLSEEAKGLHPYICDTVSRSIFISSSFLCGVAVPDCIAASQETAEAILELHKRG